jgi:hypothetical protein
MLRDLVNICMHKGYGHLHQPRFIISNPVILLRVTVTWKETKVKLIFRVQKYSWWLTFVVSKLALRRIYLLSPVRDLMANLLSLPILLFNFPILLTSTPMQAVCSSKTLVTRLTQHHNPEDHNLNHHHSENLKLHIKHSL